MHTIARLALSLILVTAGSFTVIAQPKPAAKKSAPAHSAASQVNIPIPDIKYTKFVLKNGLTRPGARRPQGPHRGGEYLVPRGIEE